MDKNSASLEQNFRKFTLDKLKILHIISNQSTPVVTSSFISNASGMTDRELGGLLSSLSRTKINEEPLISPIAKTKDEGVLWRLNERYLPKKEVKNISKKILDEARPYLQTL